MINARKFLTISLSVFGLFVVASISSSSAFAGYTCCTPDYSACTPGINCPYPGGQNPSCSAPAGGDCQASELKNPGTGTGAYPNGNECPVGTISNACDLSGATSGDSNVCRYATVVPATLTLKINQSYNLASNAFANGATIGSMTSVSSSPAVAIVSPSAINLCCEWNYNYRAIPVTTTVSALREGKTKITSTFKAQDSAGTCFQSSTVTVSGIADPLKCVPGATCVSNTGAFSAGAKVTCSMPAAANLSLGTPNYQVRCTPYKGTIAQPVIAKSSTTGSFANFTLASGVTRVACSFRYCQTATNKVITCSAWGTI